MDFVDTLFDETLSDVTCVEVMVLSLRDSDYYGIDKIISWIDGAISLNVREISLDVVLKDECESLFWCLSGCTTLTRLKLGREFSVSLPSNFNLPNLKLLVLFGLTLYDINKMIARCPALEELCLKHCESKDIATIRIQSHILKKLTIKGCWEEESECGLVIDAPNLETLKIVDTAPDRFSVSNFRSLRTADISLWQLVRKGDEFVGVHYYDGGVGEIYFDEFNDELKQSWFDVVAKLVTACSSTSQLYLSQCSTDALQESSVELTEFQELSSVTICRPWGSGGWTLLARLLCKSPNLEKLTVKVGIRGRAYSIFESLMVSLPVCLELHLKVVEFWLAEEEEYEIKLVDFLLKHGKVFQKLTLKCLPFKKPSSLSRLNMLQGHSKINFQPR